MMKMRSGRKKYKHRSFFHLGGGVRKYHAVLLFSRIEEKGLAQHFHAMSANIHNLCGAWSLERGAVHPSPREMVVSSQTMVWNHTQLLHDMLLYRGTFYILLSGPGKINAKSQLSPSYFAALKHCPLSRFFRGRKSPYIHRIKSLRFFFFFFFFPGMCLADNNSLAAELFQKMK